MMFLAAYLYLAGALAVYLYIDEAVGGIERSVPLFSLVIIIWPAFLPIIVIAAVIHEIIKLWQRRAVR
jgi:hypothetical protein